MKRKSFGVPTGLGGSLAAQLGPDEAPRIEVVPLTELELDPENPRQLGIRLEDVLSNFQAADPCWQRHREVLDGLIGLAASIRAEGVVQPIRIYRRGEKYRVAFGERRVLASAIAGKPSIPAVILSERPDRLRLVQLVENTQRVDLGLWLRIRNINEVLTELRSAGEGTSAETLASITGLSLAQAFRYLQVLKGPRDVLDAIESGLLRNLDAAARLCAESDSAVRATVLASLTTATGDSDDAASVAGAKAPRAQRGAGRPPRAYKLGSTNRPEVIRHIMETVWSDRRLDIDWADKKVVSKAFQAFLKELEERL